MGPAPDRPAMAPSHSASTPTPSGETAPIPVTTTRMRWGVIGGGPGKAASELAVDHVDGLADGVDVLRLFVGDLDAELVLERHQQLDYAERIDLEILFEARLL